MFSNLDWAVVAVYFVGIFVIAFWSSIRGRSTESSANYFLAGRNVGWFVIGASLFASNIGSEHLVGLAGAGASSGVASGQFEVLASLILLILGWVFVPFYLRSGVFTMPEFLERRYSSGARWYLAIISIIAYVLTKISVTIAAGGIVFETLLGVPFWTGAIVVVIGTGIYTVFGGLKAVLYTDLAQAFVLIGGSIAVTVIGLGKIGGIDGLTETVLADESRESYFSMWRSMNDPDFPWTGILFGAPILGIWYWCTDQFIVQRVLSAKNLSEARRGTVFAGFLKLLPVFIFVIPGTIAFALQLKGELSFDKNDQAFSAMVGGLLPDGLRGLVAAGLLAALMSSLSSVFNSCSTLFTWDIYRKMKPQASEKQMVMAGQIATVVLVGFGLLWILAIAQGWKGLYIYIQSVQAYISPPIAAAFLIGVFWKRATATGALASLWVGFVLGVGRLLLEAFKVGKVNTAGPGEEANWVTVENPSFIEMVATINFLHIAIFLFLICSAVLAIVSLRTPPESEEKLAGITYATTEKEKSDDNGRDLLLTLLLIVGVFATWLLFS